MGTTASNKEGATPAPIAPPGVPQPPRTAVVQPSTAAQPTQPVQPNQPARPAQSVQPASSKPPASPVKPATMQPTKPADSNKPAKKGANKLLITGIVLCALAVTALVCALVFVFNKPAVQPTTSDITSFSAPTNTEIEEALENANIETPDLSSYKYINTEDLQGPEFKNIATEQGRSSNVCNASATANFKNDSITVEQPVSMRFTQNNNEWVAGEATTSPANVIPTGPADITLLTKDLPVLLTDYKQDLGNQFTNCDIVADDKGLTVEGGTAKFALSKDAGDGTVYKCNVDVNLKWDDNKGWVAEITSVSDVTTENSQNSNGGNSGSSTPDALLECNTGDLVQVPGIIDYVNDHILLRTDNFIRVILDGRTYEVHYFELVDNSMQFTVGAHVEVTGEISATGTQSQAPLVINLNY